jgi:uncharacterized Tic20 family protein
MTARTMIKEDDRTLAILAHLSGLAGYVIPVGGVVVPLVMWMTLADRPNLAAIAKQALFLNIAIFLLGVAAFLMIFTLILIPVAWIIGLIATPIAIAFPIVGAIKASRGELYRYPLIGALV